MRLALFKDVENNWESVFDDHMEGCATYVRISDYVEVDFPPLTSDEVVTKQVAMLEEAKKKVQAQAERKITELNGRIGELLALPEAG